MSTSHQQGKQNFRRKGRVEAIEFGIRVKASASPKGLQLQNGFTTIEDEGETDNYK